MNECVFCGIVTGAMPAFRLYEDERTLAFLDINPWGRGHTLVVPKEHADNLFDASPEDVTAVLQTVRDFAPRLRHAVGADGMAIAQLNGAAAGQTVFHLHVHLLPRVDGEGIPTPPIGGSPSQDQLAAVHEEILHALRP